MLPGNEIEKAKDGLGSGGTALFVARTMTGSSAPARRVGCADATRAHLSPSPIASLSPEHKLVPAARATGRRARGQPAVANRYHPKYVIKLCSLRRVKRIRTATADPVRSNQNRRGV